MATLSWPSHLARTSKGRGPPVTLKKHRSLAQHTHTGKISTALRSVRHKHPWVVKWSWRQADFCFNSVPITSNPCLFLYLHDPPKYLFSTWHMMPTCFQLGIWCVNQHRKKAQDGEFPGSPVLGTPRIHCQGSIPGRGTRIQHAVWCSQKRNSSGNNL